MTTGQRIKEARLAAGLTQSQLAEKVGLKFSAIHKYESGLVVNLKRETISALADALNVKPSWLMCMEDEDTEQSKHELLNGLFDRLPPEKQALALALLKELSQNQVGQDDS